MTAADFPVRLDRVFFTRSIVIALPEFKAELPVQLQPENKLDLAPVDGQPHRYLSTMRTLINRDQDTALPYVIDFECVGVFLVDENLDEEETKRVVTQVSHNVLYGAIREAVCMQTARQPYGPIMLGLSLLQPMELTDPPRP